VHKNIRSLMVKTIFESDDSMRNYNEKTKEIRIDVCMHTYERFLCDDDLILNHPTTDFYATSR
jgi:hypothetical protein